MVDVLVIDNIDSFVYNLVQYIGELGPTIRVEENSITVDEIKKLDPSKIVISPGPGRPDDAGISKQLIAEFAPKKVPILGVCLGHQCIGEVFGAKIVRAKRLMHGKTSMIHHNSKEIFKKISNPFEATRYHSLIIDKGSVPKFFDIIAYTQDKEIMGIKHKKYPVWGVQFHPESILTKEGKSLLKNFLDIKK